MSFEQAHVTGTVAEFKQILNHRLIQLSNEFDRTSFVMPVGIVLLVDEVNGGDQTAKELVKRFNLLNFESRNVIDFFFLGWQRAAGEDDAPIAFDLARFEEFRYALRATGVKKFGGNADLLLVDAVYSPEEVRLNFEEAIRIDLSASSAEKNFPTLGQFLQSLIDTAESVRAASVDAPEEAAVFAISDQLGLAIAGESFLDFIYTTWGKLIGAKKMAAVAVRQLGPAVALKDL